MALFSEQGWLVRSGLSFLQAYMERDGLAYFLDDTIPRLLDDWHLRKWSAFVPGLLCLLAMIWRFHTGSIADENPVGRIHDIRILVSFAVKCKVVECDLYQLCVMIPI